MLRWVALLTFGFVACGGEVSSTKPPAQAPAAASGAEYAPPARSKESGCVARGALPDAACTPGATMTSDRDVICKQSTRARRHVSEATHRAVFVAYGIGYPQPRGAYEVDHLIPLELGGDNVLANLWAEPTEPRPGFHEKDRVENYLHDQVCKHGMNLVQAQREIATNWTAVWKKIESSVAVESDDDGETE